MAVSSRLSILSPFSLQRTRIKICGITRPEDARAAIELGADAIGLVFYASSPRCVDVERAWEIARVVPPFVTLVGLFVNESKLTVRRRSSCCNSRATKTSRFAGLSMPLT